MEKKSVVVFCLILLVVSSSLVSILSFSGLFNDLFEKVKDLFGKSGGESLEGALRSLGIEGTNDYGSQDYVKKCKDSDATLGFLSGKSYDLKGTCIDNTQQINDSCISSIFVNSLKESFCLNNICQFEYYDCGKEGKVCESGACVKVEDEGLDSYWKFDEGSSGVVKDFADAHDGIIYGAIFVDGKVRKALNFDGLNDYIKLPASNSLIKNSSSWTVSAWFKADSITSKDNEKGNRIITFHRGRTRTAVALMVGSSNKAEFCYSGKSGSGGDVCSKLDVGEILVGNWYFFAVSYDGKNVKMYLNNNTPVMVSKTPPTFSSDNAFIGRGEDSGTYYFNGTIDEVIIYNRSLSEEEIKKEYICGACLQKIKSCEEGGGIICEDYEVCNGVVLKAGDTNRCCKGECKLPDSFDWTKKHGENLMPPLKTQKGADCHEVATIGTFEAQINLYYNQKLNKDLSIQMLIDCQHNTGEIEGLSYKRSECFHFSSNPPENYDCGFNPYCSTMYTGIADEACDSYVGRDIYCDGKYFMQDKCCSYSYICNNWQDRIWKNSDFRSYGIGGYIGSLYCDKEVPLATEDEIKKELILNGPMKAYIQSMYHSAVLFGYNGLSDWKTIDKCEFNTEFCIPQQGCINKSCNPNSEDFSVCITDPELGTAFNYTFTCRQEYKDGPYLWFQKEDTSVNLCVARELVGGYKSCSEYNSYTRSFNQVVEYSPGEGDTIWIFNMGGGQLSEARKSIYDLSMLDIPLGPFIPPKGESYKILCVDKDNDNFCNWGLTKEKPSTCPSNCKEEKDWDDSNNSIGALGQYGEII